MRRTLTVIFGLIMILSVFSWGQTTKPDEKPKVAVIDFVVKGDVGIKDAGEAVSELLLAKLPEAKFYLVERSQLASILQEIDLTIALVRDNPDKVYGKLRGVKYLVIGSVTKLGDLTITARLVDVTTGHIVQRAEVSAEDARGLKDSIGKLAKSLIPMTAVERDKAFAPLMAQAKAIVKNVPSYPKKPTDNQKGKLLEAKRDVDAALNYKEEDEEALALKKQIETYLVPEKEISLDFGNKIRMKLVLIPSGKFIMGSLGGEKGHREDEGPRHEVTISKPFYMGVYHVTRGQFAAFVDDKHFKTDAEKDGWSIAWNGIKFDKVNGVWWKKPGFGQTDEHPVVCVSHNDAVAFCEWLSKKTGKTVRLPTEAQWEYACRAGTTAAYQWGDNPDEGKGWCNAGDLTAKKTLGEKLPFFNWSDGYTYTSPVGRFKKNAFGLYDMQGNAWQWCDDWYSKDYYSANGNDRDPLGPNNGKYVVNRGGGWDNGPLDCRCAFRSTGEPVISGNNAGFRVMVLPDDK